MRVAEALAAAAATALALAPQLARGADASVALRWKPVDGAVAYELEIFADAALQAPVVRERVTAAGYRWRELPDERRWWRVRGVDARGRAGRWSEVRTIEPVLRAPEPRRPDDGAVLRGGRAVELGWAAPRVADRYEVEVARDGAFDDVVERRRGPEPRAPVALGAGAYHRRVRAEAGGKSTRWSPARRFSVAAVAVAAAPPAPEPAVEPAQERSDDEAAEGVEEEGEAEFVAALVAAAEAAIEGSTPTATATATATPTPTPTPTPTSTATATPTEPPSPAVADASPPARELGLRAGARVGWHTTFGAISAISPGVELEWRIPARERLSLSARIDYYGASATLPPLPGIATPQRASAEVVPLAVALVWARPGTALGAYAGAGAEAQLVHTVVAGLERLDVVPAALLVGGVSRRAGRGDVFLEAAWASGALEAASVRVRTGGLTIAAGWRGWP
jgi:hypothetical protein